MEAVSPHKLLTLPTLLTLLTLVLLIALLLTLFTHGQCKIVVVRSQGILDLGGSTSSIGLGVQG